MVFRPLSRSIVHVNSKCPAFLSLLIPMTTSLSVPSPPVNYLVKPVRLEDLRVALNITMQQYREYMQVVQERDQAKADLKNRKLIERAKGILMDNFDMKEKQAMEFMQKKARDSHKKLNVIAQGIIQMDEAIK